VNDGLVSTFLLVAGVAGAGLSMTDILLTAIAGALAGAVSMSAGEYIATKTQNEVLKGEIKLERSHIKKYKKQEIEEVSALLGLIGIAPEETHLREQMITYYESRPEALLLKIMVALEFGVTQTGERSPLTAALYSGMLFIVGSLPSVLPFLARGNSSSFISLVVAAVATCIALLLVGMIKTWATRGNWLTAAIENLTVAGIGGAFAYGVGVLFDTILN
jgi:VIT1/CCC1 family predicted Fe2+/Mn2+ transporter